MSDAINSSTDDASETADAFVDLFSGRVREVEAHPVAPGAIRMKRVARRGRRDR
jgi:hypothetical protein